MAQCFKRATKVNLQSRHKGGFTLLELLLVIGIILILAALLLPAIQRGLAKGKQTQCLNNLRQIGIGFQSWAHDHGDRLPMQVPYRDGGSLEANRQLLRGFTDLSFAPRHFQVLSNELSTPKIVICPADKKTAARSFPALGNTNFSYWVSPRASLGNSIQFLSGDWNVTSMRIDTNSGPNPAIRLQFDNTLHQNRGNLLFADGHVELMRSIGNIGPSDGNSGISPGPGPTGSGGGTGASTPATTSGGTGSGAQTSATTPKPQPQPSPPASPNDSPARNIATATPISETTNQFQTNRLARTNSDSLMVGIANPGSRPIALASAETAANKPRAVLAVDTPHKVKEAEPAEEDESPLMQLMKETSKWMLILLLILIMILLAHRYLTRRKRNLGPAGVDS